ncbi:hypothetical protein PM082_016868 [Marasmius tenuissimus]|nr:hypothetical protein PM082_016868 [Marasmius tenuissimus]
MTGDSSRDHVLDLSPPESSIGTSVNPMSPPLPLPVAPAWSPKRFFILKSLSQPDFDLSVERGLWTTQKHNEGILDQAYRTSSEVYLIFSVNKSGEF